MQLRRDSACCEPACREPLNGTSASGIAEKGPRVSAASLQVGCTPRTYRASCDSTVVSHRLRGWLGDMLTKISDLRVPARTSSFFLRDRKHEDDDDGAVQSLCGLCPDRPVWFDLSGRPQALGRDLVHPREQKRGWEADGHQDHHQPVGPHRYVEHVKEDVYRIEDEPADDQIEDPDPDNVAVLQLL